MRQADKWNDHRLPIGTYARIYQHKFAPTSTLYGQLTECSSLVHSRYAHVISRPVNLFTPKDCLDEGRSHIPPSEIPARRPKKQPRKLSKRRPKREKRSEPFPIAKLSQLLTPPRSKGSPLNINTFVELYNSAQKRLHLNRLSSAHFSAFVSLLGSLSLSSYGASFRFLDCSPLIDHMSPESFGNYWSYIVEVVEDKAVSGSFIRTLGHSDRYWLMRAHLGLVMSLKTKESTQGM